MKGKLYSCVLLGILTVLKVSPTVDSASGCSGDPCGKGAECRAMANFAIVCVCPENTVGDPFESCSPSSTPASSSTSGTSGSMSTTSSVTSSHPPSSSSMSTSPMMVSTVSVPSTSQTTFSHSSSSSVTVPQRNDNVPPHSNNNNYMFSSQSNSRDSIMHRNRDSSSNDMAHNSGQPLSIGTTFFDFREKSKGDTPISLTTSQDSRMTSTSSNSHDSHRGSGFFQDSPSPMTSNSDRNSHFRDTPITMTSMSSGHESHSGSGLFRNSPVAASPSGQQDHFGGGHFRDSAMASQGSSFSNGNENKYAVKDPMGVYTKCMNINNVVVCADETEGDSHSGQPQDSSRRQSMPGASMNEYSHRSNQNHDSRPSSSSSSFPSSSSNGMRQEFVVNSQSGSTKFTGGSSNFAPPSEGDPQQCMQYCGKNSICRMFVGRPICGCPEGTTGDPSVSCVPAEDQLKMMNRCQKHTDCLETLICDANQCNDPCKSSSIETNNNLGRTAAMDLSIMTSSRDRDREVGHFDRNRGAKSMTMSCGRNAKCQVIKHTQLCGCLDGFTGNPYSGCV